MFIMQFVTYFAFYISCLVFLSFFPFLLVFLVGYLATYIVRRIRGHMTSRRFPVKLAEEIHNDRECAICMQEYQPQEQIKELTCDARHHFHKECIDQWLKVQSVCPLCRKNFLQ
jgi:E3 ubiquitin-protein ligase RNF38/44